MAIDKVVGPLLRVPLFAGLKPLHITEIARRAERMTFRANSTITQAGTMGDGALLIAAGDAVRMPDAGSPQEPEPIEPGSLIGELAMLVDHIYGATVVAKSRVHCLKITRAGLYEQMEQDPDLADHFSRMLTSRLKNVAAEMRKIDDMIAEAAARWSPRQTHLNAATPVPLPPHDTAGAAPQP